MPTQDFASAETSISGILTDVPVSAVPMGMMSSPLPFSSSAVSVATSAPASAPGEGRFPPGTILAQRYRVSGLLGRGGMGEVYKVTDLLIGQVVALKLLPESLSSNPAMLERIRNEVRIARQVTHPNVCRVHDLGETDGQLYLTMEYVDGEDLQSLLRRIGSVPVPKALDIARRLCHGLAAAHDKGVLHRDLKPGNILIDGRGNLLISDFGLAALAGTLDPADIRNGTPAYMAPEQLTGLEVTARSDIFSLGLVIYEVFAGQPPYEADRWDLMVKLQEQANPAPLSDFVKDIDPAIERAVRACLAPNPMDRPASAMAVAALLPGNDPLAAALAAGEMPSPETVAAAGESRSLPRALAAAGVAVVVLGLMVNAWTNGRSMLLARSAGDWPPAALQAKARELMGNFGYPARTPMAAGRLEYHDELIDEASRRDRARAAELLNGRFPPPVSYRYYASIAAPADLDVPFRFGPDPVDPPSPGWVRVELDLQGKLLGWTAVPVTDPAAPATHFDFTRLLTAAGLEPARMQPAQPVQIPPAPFDERAAWTSGSLRVEAAAWRGRPVAFSVMQEGVPQGVAGAGGQVLGMATRIVAPIAVIALVGAAILAWLNLRRKRCDRRGAVAVGLFSAGCSLMAWLLSTVFSGEAGGPLQMVVALHTPVYFGVWAGTMYLALEPYVRRTWPWALISWNRLLSGSWRDPLAARHVLLGIVGGVVLSLAFRLHGALYGPAADDTRAVLLPLVDGGLRLIAGLFYAAQLSLIRGCVAIFIALLFCHALGRRWLGIVAAGMLWGIAFGAASSQPWLSLPFFWLVSMGVVWFVVEYGLLTGTMLLFTGHVVAAYPMTLDRSAWFFGEGLFGALALIAMAAVAAVNAARQTGVQPPGSRVTY